MILTDTKTQVETSGVTSRGFKILASRKAFEILSSGLYSHKIKAVVRELGTNAADAHVAAGNPAPFVVQLPNKLFPYFEVRDYGTGLSDESVNTLYTTYFDSDKTASNAFTGCLGLGSKSPFAYTDSFTVESRYDGVVTTYTAYLDENKIPAISRLDGAPTTEPNGLTVRIPVKEQDFHEFEDEAAKVYEWFATRPTVHGYDFSPKAAQSQFVGPNYVIGREKESTSYKSYIPGTLVMGNVAYPIDFSKVPALAKWRDYGIVLYAPVGSVDIAASRESLSYDADTIEYLEGRGLQLDKELVGHTTRHVADAATLWEARTRLQKLQSLFRSLKVTATWRGEAITPTVQVDPPTRQTEYHVVNFSWKHGKYGRKTFTRSVRYNVSDSTLIITGKDVWIADTKNWKDAIAGVTEADTPVYVLLKHSAEFLARTGLDAVVKPTSGIPVEKAVNSRPKKPKSVRVPVYEFCPDGSGDSGSITACRFWKKVEKTPAGGCYVIIDRFNPVGTANSVIKNVLATLAALGHPVRVYGVRESDKGKVGPAWTPFQDRVNKVKTEAFVRYADESASKHYAHNGVAAGVVGLAKNTKDLKTLPRTHPVRAAVEAYLSRRKSKESPRIKAFRALCEYWESKYRIAEADSTLARTVAAVVAAYPLLDVLTTGRDDTEYGKKVIKYVTLVDGAK